MRFGTKKRILGGVAALAAVVAVVVNSSAAPSIPVPELVAIVHTESNGVVKDTPMLIGGVPALIDVDQNVLLGLLSADIDVSVNLIAASELPGNPLVPNIVIRRDPTALLRHAPAPNLKVSVRIIIDNVPFQGHLATIDYGFETPPGARMPNTVTAKLLGSISSGFVDPLKAKIETPGYSGPLKFNIHANTDSFDGTFGLKFDPLPETININEDPADNGLDFTYDHSGANSDVKLDATADLKSPSGEARHVGASVERLPNHLQLTNTNTADATSFDYHAGADNGKPDVEATYRDTQPNGRVSTDVDAKLSGLPAHMTGTIDTRPGTDGSTDIDGVNFGSPDGDRIGAIDFTAKNFTGAAGPLPDYTTAGPDQVVSVASVRLPDGTSRFRAAGRLENIKSGTFNRTGPTRDKLDVTTDVGNGVKPLRAILDVDSRGATDSPSHFKLDSTIDPLPQQIHAQVDPGNATNPLHLTYDSSATANIDANALIATGPSDTCGADRVICATARVDHLPPHIDVQLPKGQATDVAVSHNGTGVKPDISATADIGPDSTKTPPSTRTFASASLTSVPNEVRGRLDTTGGTLHAAEFHACAFDFSSQQCTSAIGAIGKVRFAVRDQPTRAGLPGRPDTAPEFVTLLSRHPSGSPEHFEIAGAVDAVRNVVFRQRGDLANGDAGALGANVDIGTGGDPFDVVVDKTDDTTKKAQSINVHVGSLPSNFTACVRPNGDHPAPTNLPSDNLLNLCETSKIPADGTGVTPLTAVYTAKDAANHLVPTTISADVSSTEPDDSDKDALGNPFGVTTALHAGVTNLPGFLQADVLKPATAPLRLNYTTTPPSGTSAPSNPPATNIDFALAQQRSGSVCADPRPHRKSLCIDGTLSNLPANFAALYDPDDSKGDIDFQSSPPADAQHKLSIDPLHISKVGPDPTDTPLLIDAGVDGLTPHLAAKIQSAVVDGAKAPARISFDACPDGGDCAGIDRLQFNVKTSLVGDPLPAVPDPNPAIPGFNGQQVSFVQSGDDFRATGLVRQLRNLSYSKLTDAGQASPVTHIKAGFGDGSPLRAFIDRQTTDESEHADAVITDAPDTVDVCFRGAVDPSLLQDDATDFCQRSDANGDHQNDAARTAVQAAVDAGAVKPDIDIRDLAVSTVTKDPITGIGHRTVITGSVKIDDLAQRIDALIGSEAGSDLSVEGHDLGDGPGAEPKDVAGRVTFALQTFADKGTLTGFPWQSLDGGLDPKDDPINDDGAARNYIQLVQQGDDKVRAEGSIPDIKSLSVSPNPCTTNRPDLFPTAGFTAEQAPAYKCARVSAAAGHPLGIAVRTFDVDPAAPLDHNGQVLSIESGHISAMPDSLSATITKIPDAAKTLPTCSIKHETPCRPPMVSIDAPHSGADPVLDAKLATGELNDLTQLRGVEPADPVSARLAFDEDPHPDAFPNGVRVRVGQTVEGRTSIRMNAKLALTPFLDLDSPTTFSCTHIDTGAGASCDASGVGSALNKGFATQDIGFGVVAANDKHFGNPDPAHPRLGRVALLVTPLDDLSGGQQIVITGAPVADNKDPIVGRPTIGAESHDPENPAPPSIEDKGFDAPAHLDAQVFMRNAFNAKEDGADDHKQVSYTQLDGRVNVPLSLTLRLNNLPPSPAIGPDALALANFVPNVNRKGALVPGVQLELRNAPSSNNQDDYAKPTFRIRTELRDDLASETKDDPNKDEENIFSTSEGFTCNVDERAVQGLIGAHFCLVVPNEAKARYLDVQLNADPYSDGNTTTSADDSGHTGPARTVDVVGGPFGADNHVEMQGWRDVDGTGGPDGKGDAADFTPVASIDLRNFNFGIKAGLDALIAGVQVDWDLLGDLRFGLAGHGVEQTRVDSHYASLNLTSQGGVAPNNASRVISDLREQERFKVTVDLFFGLIDGSVDLRSDPFDQPVQFNGCGLGDYGSVDEFWTGGNHTDFSGAGPGTAKAGISLGIPATFQQSALGDVLAVLSRLGNFIDCEFEEPSAPSLVNQTHPSPSYALQGHDVPDTPATAGPQPTQLPNANETSETGLLRLTQGETLNLCGDYSFDTVLISGTVVVPQSGLDANNHPCDGHLNISGRSIFISQPGSIVANGGTAGAKGGSIGLFSKEQMEIQGTLNADGAAGTDRDVVTGSTCQTGGTGGEGGQITVASNTILDSTNTGKLFARGGAGGAGGFGGNGGKGGHVTVNSVIDRTSHDVTGGAGFNPGPDSCGSQDTRDGTKGADGVVDGSHPDVISTVDMNSETPGPFFSGDPKVSMTAITGVPRPLRIDVCRRRVDFGGDPFQSPDLDPAGKTPNDIEKDSQCISHSFTGPNHENNLYSDTERVNDLESGVYGFFAVAFTFVCRGDLHPTVNADGVVTQCIANGGATSTPDVPVAQSILPVKSSAKIAIDKDNPTIASTRIEEPVIAGKCEAFDHPPFPSSDCTKLNQVSLHVDARDENGSGIQSVNCQLHNSATPVDGVGVDCLSQPAHINLAPGLNRLEISATDKAKNTGNGDKLVLISYDPNPPVKPTIDVTDNDAEVNGWHHVKPSIRVNTADPVPSSGFEAKGVKFFVDSVETDCGQEIFGNGAFQEQHCEPSELADAIPDEGIHVLSATAFDRVGNASTQSDTKTIKVDDRAPTSQLGLSPATPDGKGGFYVSQPFFAITAQDKPGGSGLSPADDTDNVGAGIQVQIDGGSFHAFDASADNRLGDGEHKICWFARDVAGNSEATQCLDHIKVDATAPVASSALNPASPNGANGFYKTSPVFTQSATDAGGSGLATVQFQIDDGPWTAAASKAVPEGTHDLRVRSFDTAGNESAVIERSVRVDLTKPTAGLISFPPLPNARGWFRQPRVDTLATNDARDSSGADGGTTKLDSAAALEYTGPVAVGQGTHTLVATPRDRAGLLGTAMPQSSKVDLTAPTAAPDNAAPAPILISLLGIFGTTDLHFTLGDNLTKVNATVLVYNAIGGALVRHIPVTAGTDAGGFRAAGTGVVTWDGRIDGGAGALPGTYVFRVQVADEAGNTTVSTESPEFLVIQGILPLGLSSLDAPLDLEPLDGGADQPVGSE